ncbi:hypothetical protein BH11PSE11_BH11PSE11_28830 [soil metagenome]
MVAWETAGLGMRKIFGMAEMSGEQKTVLFQAGGRGRNKSPQRGHVEIDGRRSPAWQTAAAPDSQAICWLTDGALHVQYVRGDPLQKVAQDIRLERFGLEDFLAGSGRDAVTKTFGPKAVRSIEAEARRQGASPTPPVSARPPSGLPDREWKLQDPHSGRNIVCTVTDAGVSIYSRRGEDARTEEYGEYTLPQLAERDLQRALIRELGESIARQVLAEASLRHDQAIVQIADDDLTPARSAAAHQRETGAASADDDRASSHGMERHWRHRARSKVSAICGKFMRVVRTNLATGNARADNASTCLSLLTAGALVAWLLTTAALELGDDAKLWWHARIQRDLMPLSATVTGHDVREYKGDGSWMRGPSRPRAWYYGYPVIAFSYLDDLGDVAQGRVQLPETVDRRAKAFSYMDRQFPIGSRLTVLAVPNQTQRFLYSPEQAPSSMGMLVRLATAILLFLFIHLPLALIVSLLVPSVLVWLISWPFHRRRA